MSLAALPPGGCACPANVFGPLYRYPLAADRFYTPPLASSRQYLAMLDGIGLTRGVLVQATASGWDHRGTVAALQAGSGRLRGIVVPHPDVSDAELADLQTAGVCGIRFNQVNNDAGGTRRSGVH